MAQHEVTVDIQCPVEGCDFKPPANLSQAAQLKSLERHITMRHSTSELANMVDGVKKLEQQAQQPPQPEQPQEPEQPQQPQEPQPEPPKEKVSVKTREPRVNESEPRRLAAVTPISDKQARIQARTEKWGAYLHEDFNPLLVAGTAKFTGIPDEWLEGGPANGQPATFATPDGKIVTFWQPVLKEQLTLSEKDCSKLARAGAIFAESPMGQAITIFLESNTHWIALGSALAVAGSYGWKVMRIRTEVDQLKQIFKQLEEQQQPQPGSNGNAPEEASAAA